MKQEFFDAIPKGHFHVRLNLHFFNAPLQLYTKDAKNLYSE